MNREVFKGTWQQTRTFSPAVKTRGGDHVWLAGVGAVEDEEGNSLAGDFDGQVRATFEAIRKTLARAGGTLDDIVTMTVFVTDMKNGTRFTQLRGEHFTKGFPASALIGVRALARPEMMVEVQAIAVVDA
ncbi:MAG: RidA family protein [Nitrospinota bacterium]